MRIFAIALLFSATASAVDSTKFNIITEDGVYRGFDCEPYDYTVSQQNWGIVEAGDCEQVIFDTEYVPPAHEDTGYFRTMVKWHGVWYYDCYFVSGTRQEYVDRPSARVDLKGSPSGMTTSVVKWHWYYCHDA